MGKIADLNEARSEFSDVKTWTCESCDTMTDPGEKWCRSCRDYWQDVSAGMFESDDET